MVLGNLASAEDVPALAAALSDDEPLVRGHAAWALGRIRSPGALDALRARVPVESDFWVMEEMHSALASPGG